MGSGRARSVYLTTHLLGRLSPLRPRLTKVLPWLPMYWNMQISIRQIYWKPSRWSIATDELTWLPPFWIQQKDLLMALTFHSFWVPEKSATKNWEFPDLLPFPLPVFCGFFWEVFVISPLNNGRMTDSDLSELWKQRELSGMGSWILFSMIKMDPFIFRPETIQIIRTSWSVGKCSLQSCWASLSKNQTGSNI